MSLNILFTTVLLGMDLGVTYLFFQTVRSIQCFQARSVKQNQDNDLH